MMLCSRISFLVNAVLRNLILLLKSKQSCVSDKELDLLLFQVGLAILRWVRNDLMVEDLTSQYFVVANVSYS